MALSIYHQKYIERSNEEIQKRSEEKYEELSIIFEKVQLKTEGDLVKVAVLGCGDKRFIKYHKSFFSDFIKKPIDITTFDITIDHLLGEENIVKHDCTLPLPNAPYDIIYSHVLLKFIETEKQWDLIKNSYEALKHHGFCIHILDKGDYETESVLLPNEQFAVPLVRWKKELEYYGIKYQEIPIKFGLALIVFKD